MGCVNIRSKEFKNLASRNDLDTNLLELIIHKYWHETGSEESFPSDEYIQKELGNTQYEEPLESVRDLWKREYSTPREYKSFEELQAAQEKAAKFFPASAIVYYKNAKGNYVLSIKQPVEETNKNSLDNLISEENSTFEDSLTYVKTTQKDIVQQNLSEYDKLNAQIDNLLNSDIISASEIRHIAELVVNSISDNITQLQKNEGLVKEQFPTLSSNMDFQKSSRKQIVEAVGLDNLIKRAKALFDPEIAEYEDFDTIEQADLIIQNWDAIMILAADIFALNEGFGISKNYDNGRFSLTESNTVDYDNFNESQDEDSIRETEGDEQEHWQVETRTIDVLNSMSALVRLALHQCYQIDAEGNKVISKWGIAERVNARQAVNSILRWTQGSLSLNDMINKLSEKQKDNPWLSQLIERLSDRTGNETDFQSQFYGVFSKNFQLYSIVLLEDGKYSSIPVNSHPALTEAYSSISTQYKIGEHPLFTSKGVNIKLLGSSNTTGADSTPNLHKSLTNLRSILDRLNHNEELSEDVINEAVSSLDDAYRIFGYPVTENIIKGVVDKDTLKKLTNTLGFIVNSLDSAYKAQQRNDSVTYDPFAYKKDNSIGGSLRNFLKPVTDTMEDIAISAFYDSGKMYQSYTTPSYMTKLMNKFKLKGQEFENFIMSEYGNSEWFKYNGRFEAGWRNKILRLLVRDEKIRDKFGHRVELNFNKHNYMRNMTDAEYALSLITEYWSEAGQEPVVPTWFRIPMLSNKPSSEFLKLPSFRGDSYKDEITEGLYEMFLQEVDRINTVIKRNHSKNDPQFIKNFDKNGKKFNFLPFLNSYLDNTAKSKNGRTLLTGQENDVFASLLQRKTEGISERKLSTEEEVTLMNLAGRAIRNYMEEKVHSIMEEWRRKGIFDAAEKINGIGSTKEDVDAGIENFLWNDTFAAKSILQLTITDIAFYKDAEDLQKRLAQLHAPGTRGNIAATDYKGNRVSDGKYRTFILKDFDGFKSNIISNISEVFDRKINSAPESQKAQLIALRDSLVGKDGKYTKINVTDAQGYSSPSSYRKKAFIFGKWSKKSEDIYQKLRKGEYNYTDLETAFEPLKPFVYSHLEKNLGVSSAPITTMNVPFQAKNAEYLLIMADAIISGEVAKSGELSRPNLLRAVYDVMEESERLNPTKGIDTVQFESAIKSGLQGAMDIHQFMDVPEGQQAAFTYMMNQLYKEQYDHNGNRIYKTYDTDTFVHEASYDDYCLQQEVPEHFRNHSQAHGSQIRMIIPSDLDMYKNPQGDLSSEENQVYYEWIDADGATRKLRADEFRKEYEQTIAENIQQSIDELAVELHIESEDKAERNIALSKILQKEILGSPRYGIDLLQACSVDKKTGEFRIPKGDPIQAKRIEQLINSIIKNRVNKQKIAGGPIVQVSNFGTSRQLHIRFNARSGGLLKLENEFTPSDKYKTYKEYTKAEQAGIAYFEVFVPAWSNELYEKFSNQDGTINVSAIEATDPELLKMVSYRIPTEDKYSCAPMKVVGFMPKEAGNAIMLPYELTEIDGSDFDVDKRYVMRKDISIRRRKSSEIKQRLFEVAEKSYEDSHNGKKNGKWISEQIEMFMNNPEQMRHADAFMEYLYMNYQKAAYYTSPAKSGKIYRDNKIVDMTLAVLTNEMTADKILNPGGFDELKKMGYMVEAYRNPANEGRTWEELQKMSPEELKDLSYSDKDLTLADTQVQFYHQNSAGSNLIGVFAVNKVAHATLEGNDILLAVDEVCGEQSFTIAGFTFGDRMYIDPMYDKNGNLIGKTLGSTVAASADTAKEPVLDLMNINMTTVNLLSTMIRLGMPFEDAALFMSQNIIERALSEFNKQNLENYVPLSNIIDNYLDAFRKKYGISEDAAINTEELTREELISGLRRGNHDTVDYKVMLAFQKLRKLADVMRKPTIATRFNSISSAVGPLIVDNLITEHKVRQFTDTEEDTHFYTSYGDNVDIDDILFDHPILREFSKTVDIAKEMFRDMPTGNIGFRNLLDRLPKGLSDTVYNDRKLLDQLSNFYQSYLLVASGFADSTQMGYYINEFPKEFKAQNYESKYPDNELIRSIRTGVSKKSGRATLEIQITGMDQQRKEELGNAWIDLHKKDPELSRKLFLYNFFRAGVGFSPKTFMSLVPAYVKERLETSLSDGTKVTYIDTYRNFPEVVSDIVIDQWIRNNWDNNKLVPRKGGKGTKYIVNLDKGILIVRDESDIRNLRNVNYMKTSINNQVYLWKLMYDSDKELQYKRVMPLGDNGEYVEMSLSDLQGPSSSTQQVSENIVTSDLRTQSPAETEEKQDSESIVINQTEVSKKLGEMATMIQKQRESIGKPINQTEAMNMTDAIKKNPDMFGDYLVNVFKQNGLKLDRENAIKEFKKYC